MSAGAKADAIIRALPEAARLARDLYEAGLDPVTSIREIRSSVEHRRIAGTEDAWQAAIDKLPTEPSPPAADVYDELEE
ncbi:MAG: hypothetical protein AAF715_28750 [Myxococcota bacterium]